MLLNENKIIQLYSGFKEKAKRSFATKRYDLSIRWWKTAALTAYWFYLNENDSQIEEGLQHIANLLKKKEITNPRQERCVFYDAASRDKGGLTQQYVRAIISAGWEMLYVTEKAPDDSFFIPILSELNQYADKVTVHFVPRSLKGYERVQHIYNCVSDWKGDKLFMHIFPWSVEAVVAFKALPHTITKYNINFTDHTYWVGASCVDYNFEFRQYGCNLSVYNRGLDKRQLLLLPYYPIESTEPFKGFLFDRKGKIVIFSGGSYYKIFDEQETFTGICKSLLEIDPRIVIAYAGFGSDVAFRESLKRNGISERVQLIGFRKDISAVLDHCDYYLNTYPVGGALMCIYAAMHGTPILAYHDSKKTRLEEVVCQIHQLEISSLSINDLCKKTQELIADEKKRKAYSVALRNCCISEKMFNDDFLKAVNTKQTPFPICFEDDFKMIPLNRSAKIESENKSRGYHKELVKTLGFFTSLIWHPSLTFSAVSSKIANIVRSKMKSTNY